LSAHPSSGEELLSTFLPEPSTINMPWQRRHPSKIDRKLWMYWLGQMSEPSPYLLPEWALFWERVWPGSRAEMWLAGDLERADGGVPLIRRRRFGLEWLFSQPYGTAGGWIGANPGVSTDGMPILLDASWEEFLPSILGPRTVELTMTAPASLRLHPKWCSQKLTCSSWVLDRRDACQSDILSDISDSHRRNIRQGLEHNPVIERITDAAAVAALQAQWMSRPKPASRIALHRTLGPLLATLFSPAGALRWIVARVDGRPVATTAWLVLNQRAVSVDSAIDREARCRGVNHALFARLLQELYDEGVRDFDFGGGPAGESPAGLTEFKEGWGAKPVPRSEVRHRRNAYHRLRRIMP
jgi:hypothetical protein